MILPGSPVQMSKAPTSPTKTPRAGGQSPSATPTSKTAGRRSFGSAAGTSPRETPRLRPGSTPLRDKENNPETSNAQDAANVEKEAKATMEHMASLLKLVPNLLEGNQVLEQTKKDNENLRSKLTSSEGEAQERARELWSIRAELSTTKRELQKERDLTIQQRQQIGASKDREAELLRKIQELESRLQERTAKDEALWTEHKQMEEEFERTKEAESDAKESLVEEQAKVEHLTTKADELLSERAQLQEQLTLLEVAKEEAESDAQETLVEEQAKVEHLTTKADELLSERAQLKEQLTLLEEAKEEAESDAQETLVEEQAKVEQLTTKANDLLLERTQLHERLTLLEDAKKEADSDAKDTLGEEQAKVEQLTTKADELLFERTQLQEQLTLAAEAACGARKAHEEEQVKNVELSAKVEEGMSAHELLKEQFDLVKEAEFEVRKAHIEEVVRANDLSTRVEELEGEHQQQQHQLSQSRTAAEEMREKHKEEEAKSAMLESERDNLSEQLAEAHSGASKQVQAELERFTTVQRQARDAEQAEREARRLATEANAKLVAEQLDHNELKTLHADSMVNEQHLRSQLEADRENRDQAQQELDQLKDVFVATRDAHVEACALVEKAAQRESELQGNLDDLQEQIANMRDEAEARAQAAARVEARVNFIEEERVQSEQEMASQSADMQEVEANLDAARAENEDLAASVAELQHELDTQWERHESSALQERESFKLHEEASKQANQRFAETVAAEHKSELANSKEECKELEEKIRALESTLTEVCEEAERQLAKHQATETALQKELNTALLAAPLSASAPRLSTPRRRSSPGQSRDGQVSPRAPTAFGRSVPAQGTKTRAAQPAYQVNVVPPPEDLTQVAVQVADLQRDVASHQRAREQAEERALQLEEEVMLWQRKAAESTADHLEVSQTSGAAAGPQKRGDVDWTTYGVHAELEGEDVDEQVRIQYLTVTTEQLRSHCQNLEVENASMKDLMTAFELGLENFASSAGHVNHKQKIRYTLQLKDTINRLLEELRRSRSRILQIENGRIYDFEASPAKPWAERSVSTTTTTTRLVTMTVGGTDGHEQSAARRKSCH